MTPEDLAVLAAVSKTRVKTVPKDGGSPWGSVPIGGTVESRAWSLGGNVD